MNSLLAAYIIYNNDRFLRIRSFGDNKSKLALVIFGQKFQNSMLNISKDATIDLGQKKISLELTEEEEARLENVFNELQQIKKRYDFSNIENYVTSVMKNFSAIDRSEVITIEKIRGFLDNFCLSNFFKQTPNITNINFLNFKDGQFIRRLDFIFIVV